MTVWFSGEYRYQQDKQAGRVIRLGLGNSIHWSHQEKRNRRMVVLLPKG